MKRDRNKPEWVLLGQFCTMTGYDPETVRQYRRRGIWPDKVITIVRGRKIHVHLSRYDRWVETGELPRIAA